MLDPSVGRDFFKMDVKLKSGCGAMPIGLVNVVRLEAFPLWLCVCRFVQLMGVGGGVVVC